MTEPILAAVPKTGSSLRRQGVGKGNIVPPIETIANAIDSAIHRRLTELPMSPPKVRAALDVGQAGERGLGRWPRGFCSRLGSATATPAACANSRSNPRTCAASWKWDRRYPGLGEHLEEETTVAISGEIHEAAYFPADPRRL
jgi:hypothetical protein